MLIIYGSDIHEKRVDLEDLTPKCIVRLKRASFWVDKGW